MITVNDVPRRSGKTTKVTALMEYDKELYCILPSNSHIRLYPKHLQDRLLSGNDTNELYNLMRGRRIKKVVMDEGFMYSSQKLLKLYYFLGQMNVEVIVYGTSHDHL